MPVEVPVEQSIYSTSEEEELKSNDTTSVVALGSKQQTICSFFTSVTLHCAYSLNRWCENLFDLIVCNGQISSFMINPNGLYPHVPSHATEFELALALIFKTGSTLLVHH